MHSIVNDAKHYYLGVDAGGSKTLAIIVDAQGQECGRGLAGCGNYAFAGLDRAISEIHSAIAQAKAMAGEHISLRKAWLGLAGLDRAADHDVLMPHLHTLADIVHLGNDSELPLCALEHTVGVALIAGTGSIALGRNAQGQTIRAGGWGHVFGDEGSGYDLGCRCLQAAARAADGRGEPTILLELIMQHWQLKNTDDILGEIYPDEDKAKIASLSRRVFQATRDGDSVARAIVQQAARELALAVTTLSKTLGFAEQTLPLAFAGGLLLNETDYCTLVLDCIQQTQSVTPPILVEEPALSAAHAAIAI
jgi:N-acetylglucosamine kinase-like BadF-type ATPase